MALDTSGNQKVDFVWGTTPMQTNAGRLTVATEVTTGLIGINQGSGNYFIYTSGGAYNDFANGTKIIIDGAGALADGEYTIQYRNTSSPSGLMIAVSSTRQTQFMGVPGYPAVPAGATVSISAAKNYGGSIGDKGWSKTTKRASTTLNAALGNHIVATNAWNNFPANNPNSGFPLFIWSSTTDYSWRVEREEISGGGVAGPWSDGYIIKLDYALTGAKATELAAAIAQKKTAGEIVPAWSFKDSYANEWNAPDGFIVGADYNTDMYGNPIEFTIQVAVPQGTVSTTAGGWWGNGTDVDEIGGVYPVIGTSLMLGIGEPKEVLFEGISTDAQGFYGVLGDWGVYGNAPIMTVMGNPPVGTLPAEPLPQALQDLVDGRANGGYVGIGIIPSDLTDVTGNSYYAKRDFFKIDYVQLSEGPAGTQVLYIYGDGSGSTSPFTNSYSYDYDGTTPVQLVIVK